MRSVSGNGLESSGAEHTRDESDKRVEARVLDRTGHSRATAAQLSFRGKKVEWPPR
jgi:hypothetical protein